MNRFIKTIAALSLIAFAASCSKEVSSTPAGEEVTVTFSVTSPELQTKTVSDGKTVNCVSCNVFDSQGALISDLCNDKVAMTNGSASWDVKLVSGQKYSFTFWAYNDGQEAYTLSADKKTVTVDYSKVTANDDTFDAFYAYKELTVSGALTENIKLYRPFAQLNLGAKDLKDAEAQNYKLKDVVVSVTGVATSLDLTTGKVGAETTDVAFGAAAKLDEDLKVNDKDYSYLSMVYLLVGKDEVLTNAAYTITPETGDAITVNASNAPLKANWRTNVIGDVLTVNGHFDIVVVPEYGGDQEAKQPVSVSTSEELIAALSDSEVSTISLAAGTYSVGTLAVANKTLVGAEGVIIDMSTEATKNPSDNGKAWDNVVCKNIAFNVASSENYAGFKHAGTLTFEDCTFNGVHFSYGTETYKNCTFNDGAPYNMWVYGGNVVYDGCTFNSAGKFLNVYNEGDNDILVTLVVKDCVFNSTKTNKPAVNIKETGNGKNLKFDVTITNCTLGTDNFPKETNGGLWQVDDKVTSGTPGVTVKVDGKTVWTNGAAVE